ncbi:MAG: 7-cyano-7-deazaguanine synthase [Candidatus Omnitrophica bacterium]|nr:7-cyano-7-deazaguanine synthase [Candidatus Omnitrophota bacterium]
MINTQNICKKCVLPESRPYIYLNDMGICNICIMHEQNKHKASQEAFFETDFTKLLNKYKGKGKYDCLVMCSGGKDSVAALYYMKKRYKLNPLAFTFDHGFEQEDALENIKNAVDTLGVDFLFLKTRFMHDMFSKILSTDSHAIICHVCSIWYMQLTCDTAAKYKITIIIAGWTKGQQSTGSAPQKGAINSNFSEFISMAAATKEFIHKYARHMPHYRNFPSSVEEVLKKANKKNKCVILSPHWFLPFGADEYVETIKKELNWKCPSLSYPEQSTNCYLNFISVYNSIKYFGYTHYHVEMSKLIREGLITRDEALTKLKINFNVSLLNKIAKKLNYIFPTSDI